ncbi:sensor histidine kinase [Robertmurraya massiliosenegalensis]|uniref:sensor histidine kinase n=1 Tax=Robertmurraya massiliosenegalensis TaxID=1287657 RepID=UPI0002E1F10B|nr:HAMP domain-containing sensor histidine kinase [Robertmurraya massiliosenegalensis]
MKKGIVTKLFLLTTSLCMLILAIVFFGIILFFKQYYANQKISDINTNIQSFEQELLKAGEDAQSIQRLEHEFYEENQTWITILDSVGNIKYANDFSVKIQLDTSRNPIFSNREMSIPLYSFMGLEEIERVQFYLKQGNRIMIDGTNKDEVIIPAILTVADGNYVLENRQLSEKLYGQRTIVEPTPSDIQLPEEQNGQRAEIAPAPSENPSLFLWGVIEELQLPVGTIRSNIYSNRVFVERIKQFQVRLLLHEKSSSNAEPVDYEENNIKYKLFMKPVTDSSGETNYIFAMTSLQPVDEAVQMLTDYYVYLIIFVLFLTVLATFYYSKKIAKPLIKMNNTTNKMANLDFSETIPVTSNDEIGALSDNINRLSHTLHSYINQLQQDIEKEKQLEATRKEFIAGVSHELKTPLSIMKSCISILEDDVASHKRDYYFQAMTKEVDKMDRLIVDMLELAKFESGTYKMEMEVFYIDQVIEYICEQLALDMKNKQLHIHKQLSHIEVVANPLRIEQVLTNFITNAISYTPENETIMISMSEENERVKICVENKGAHIEEKQLEKIWDRFYRGDMSRRRSKGGTGLGLAISKNILELHGVPYGVLNTEDGVLFYFYLSRFQNVRR